MNNIIAVVPVDPKERHGIEYSPGPNMVHINCERCETKCWVGPNQLALKKNQPELDLLCANCMVRQCHEWEDKNEQISMSIKTLSDI